MAFAQLTYRESLRDIEACLRSTQSKLYHMGFRGNVSRSTLADANELRDWRIYADFAQILIAIARPLYADDPIGVELNQNLYALDSTTIDLCLSLFPWAKFRQHKAAVKMHTLLDLHGSIPTFIRITEGKTHDVNVLDEFIPEAGSFYVMDRGYIDFERLYRFTLCSAFFVVRNLPRPGSSGCDLCEKIANLIPGLPLVILSGSSEVADKVLLLEMGADDYVTVPFSPRELVARLRALIRRASRVNPEGVYVFADVIADFSKTEITRAGEKIMVTPKKFKTLEFLTKNAQRVISRDELLDKVWECENYPCTRTVDNHMLRLRQKLETDPSQPSHFLTVHGLGHKFVP
jgi:DNA-binding response OmpR family regulator